ncbi:hypothetical protein FSARC_2406 [Fusarium sarcochroum]|uniref:ATP-dependent DNA ligase family profile domain-containing protein n=1 Tax=Fusarium sarcochroum TaxID=1208366 RepID=A0A8H4XDR5_9HYPO|nr:hypothetical protein FSARC_2406 [Fusarium sarcochroum]
MPLPFFLVCELLEESYNVSLAKNSCSSVVTKWFTRHRNLVDAHDTNLEALLSTLLPDKRTDRVYCIQTPSLEKIIGRALFLGSSRIAELDQHRQPGSGVDLADCVSRILTITPSPCYSQRNPVTVEEIDVLLHSLASKVKWSSPSIRASQASFTQGDRSDIEWLYRKLSAKEAKWFTRLILKSYQPLALDPHLIYRLCDPILPCVLKIQDDFATAINSVQVVRGRLLPNAGRRTPREQIMGTVKPQLGVKIGRQPWVKGRSIKHCLDMGHGRMSVEDKIDGEYCQVHIDPSKGDRCIQIFSKSGKDSTEDRVGLHGPGPQEHLMIVYYDVILLEDQSLINVRHSERFKILSKLVCCHKGWTELVPRQVIDFGHTLDASSLRKAFALTILARKEGLVLKPDEPYFDFSDQRRKFSSCCIKLKKEYIGNFGDVGDFAVVGAKYDSTKAMTYRIPGLKWTHFYVGCLDNKEAVKRWDAKPEFTIVNVVELNETMLREVVICSNPVPITSKENDRLILNLAPGVEQGSPPTVIFTKPLVFDIKCFSFDRVGNTGFWSLRFPSVTKVHFDRDFTDTISFEQLQALAKDATTATELEDSQENLQWIAKLEGADPRGIAVDAVSQLTVTTMPTPSPRKSTQNTSSSWSPTSPLATRLPAGNQLSPCRERVERARPLPIAPAATSISAPPLVETSPKYKRDSPFTKPALPRKRLKSDSESSQTGTHSSNSGNTSQPREPLGDIDGNSQSQPAMPSFAPNCPSRLSKSFSAQDDDEEVAEEIVVGLDTLHELPTETAPVLQRLKPRLVDVALARKGCRYAGNKCMMAMTEVLVSPGLLNKCKQAKALLEDHGVHNPVTDIDAWLEDEKTHKHKHKNVTKIYLLCDSNQHDEVKPLLSKIENIRQSIPFERRKWIEVHDWRLLNYVTIKEDKTVEPKYYDGWHDPWQRWCIGLV